MIQQIIISFTITDDKGNNITKQIVSSVSPKKGIINNIPENPGLCNIFGIIFMTFYKNYRDYRTNDFENGVWLKKWREVLDCFENPADSELFLSGATRGLEFAFHLQQIIIDTRGDKQLFSLIDERNL